MGGYGSRVARRAPRWPAVSQVAGWATGQWEPLWPGQPVRMWAGHPQQNARDIPPCVPELFHSPGPAGVWGWGLQAPTQPCLAQRGHPGTVSASDASPGDQQKGIKCPFRGGGERSRCPRLRPRPRGRAVPAAGKRLTRSSYSKHFVWGLCPGGSAFQGRGWDRGAGLSLGFLSSWTRLPAPRARKSLSAHPGPAAPTGRGSQDVRERWLLA